MYCNCQENCSNINNHLKYLKELLHQNYLKKKVFHSTTYPLLELVTCILQTEILYATDIKER